MTPTAEQLTETINHACGIADQLAGDYAIVLYDSTYPPGRDPDRPTRALLQAPGDPDLVPGAKWDPGVGVQAGKEACAIAAGHVARAHHLAGQAAAALAGLAVVELRPRGALAALDLRRQVDRTVVRLRYLMGHGVVRAGDDARRLAHAAAVALLEAHAALRGVLRDFDGVGEPTLEARCFNCHRPAVYVRTMECEACSRYRRRAEAQIRAGRTPKHRLRPVPRWEDAHQARRRRLERLRPGQLDVEGPLPAGSWRDGVWEWARPLPPQRRREAS